MATDEQLTTAVSIINKATGFERISSTNPNNKFVVNAEIVWPTLIVLLNNLINSKANKTNDTLTGATVNGIKLLNEVVIESILTNAGYVSTDELNLSGGGGDMVYNGWCEISEALTSHYYYSWTINDNDDTSWAVKRISSGDLNDIQFATFGNNADKNTQTLAITDYSTLNYQP